MKTCDFYSNCVAWQIDKVDILNQIIDNSKNITRATFLKHINRSDLKKIESNLGYNKNLRMSKDYHVRYHSSKLNGEMVYYFTHSAIEWVFLPVSLFHICPRLVL